MLNEVCNQPCKFACSSVLFVSQLVCLFVCLFVNSFKKKNTEQICMKFGVCLWYAVRKKQLHFGGDPDRDLNSAAGFCFNT